MISIFFAPANVKVLSMISRRLLRIKVLQIVYAFSKKDDDSLTASEKELFFSIDKDYDLYHLIFLLLIDLGRYAEDRIDLGRNKRFPSQEDLNPNLRFIQSRVLAQLSENQSLQSYLDRQKLSWVKEPELIKKLHGELIESDYYLKFMQMGDPGYRDELEVFIRFLAETLAESDDFFAILEEKSVYWNDDVEFVISMVIKTLERFKKDRAEGGKLMTLFKDEEDRLFARDLYRKMLINRKEIHELIHQFTTNWEFERIAYMDVLIISLALTEILYFPGIPVKVSMNEYIELAKFYSTDKSSIFINGVLDKIVSHLQSEKKIRKTGRGLMGEISLEKGKD